MNMIIDDAPEKLVETHQHDLKPVSAQEFLRALKLNVPEVILRNSSSIAWEAEGLFPSKYQATRCHISLPT